MGTCCHATSQVSVELTDLPERRYFEGDMITQWELTLPFSRCAFYTYSVLLKHAHKESGEKGFVKQSELAAVFHTPAWAPIRDPNSYLNNLLHKHIPHKKSADDYDYEYLMALGLIHCVGLKFSIHKAAELYDLVGAQEFIAASDKDWVRIANKIFYLSTVFAIEGAGHLKTYKQD